MADVVVRVVGESDSTEVDRMVKAIEALGPGIIEALKTVQPVAAEAGEAIKGIGDKADGVGDKLVGLSSKARDAIGGLGKAAAVGGVAFAGLAVGAGAALLKIGNDFDGAYDAIQVATGASGAELNKLKETFKGVVSDVPADFDTASGAIATLASRTGATGDVLEDLSKTVLNLAHVTGGDAAQAATLAADLIDRMGVESFEASQVLDDLFGISQATGVGFDKLAGAVTQFAPQLQAAGLGVYDATALIGGLAAAGIDAAEVMPGLTKAMTEIAKDGGNVEDGLNKIIASIQGAGSESEAQSLAVEAFGKSGIKMAAAIKSGAFDLDAMKEILKTTGGAINDTAASTADFGERMGLLKNRVMVALEPLGAIALDTMNQVVDALAPVAEDLMAAFADPKVKAALESMQASIVTVVNTLVEKFGEIDFAALIEKVQSMGETIGGIFTYLSENPAIAKIVAVVAGLAAAFVAVMVVIGPLIPVIMSVAGVIGGLVTGAGGLAAVLATVAAVLTGPVAIAIAIAVAAFLLWREKGDEIKEALSDAWETIKQAFADGVARLQSDLEEIKVYFSGMRDRFYEDIEEIKAFFAGLVAGVRKHADTIKAVLLTIITGGWYLVYQGWVKYGDDIKAKVAEIVANLKQKWEDLKAATVAKWAEIKASIAAAIQGAKDKVTEILASIAAAWDAAWSGLGAVAETAWNNMVATITTVFGIINGLVDTGIAFIRDTIILWSDTILASWQAVWFAISQVVEAGMIFIKGVASAAMKVLQGDFSGAWAAIKQTVAIGVENVKIVMNNILAHITNLGRNTLTAAIGIGKALGDGIRQGMEGAWDLVVGKLRALVNLLPQVVIDMLGIASPSKLFAQLGEWIALGLASGIQKADQKAVEALSNIIAKMVSVAGGLADFGKRITDMIVPTDAQISAAKEKYLRMTLILTDFIKSLSYLGSLMPVSSLGQAGPGQIKAINAGLVQLSQAFPAIAELRGMTAENLLTGGEADWASRLSDMVGKIAGVWGGLADNLTKMAEAKFPSESQLQQLKEATIRIALWAADSLQNPTLPSVGAAEFAASMKSITDALSTVKGLDLAGIASATETQLRIAGEKITLIGGWAKAMVEDWLVENADAAKRAAFLANLREFADMAGAAANLLKSGDVGDLSKAVLVLDTELRTLGANILKAAEWAKAMVTDWLANAGTPEERAKLVADMRDFEAMVSAAVAIAKASVIGELKAEIVVNIQAVKDVLTFVRDTLVPAIAEIVGAWGMASDAAEAATKRMGEFSAWIGAAVAIAKVTEVGELKADILVKMTVLTSILDWMRVHFAPAMQAIADAWIVAADEAERATAQMQRFAGWITAAVAVAKASEVGDLKADIGVDVGRLVTILNWLRDVFAPTMQGISDAWGVAEKEAKRATEQMQSFAGWIGAAVAVAKATEIGEIKAGILVNMTVLTAILDWMRLTFVPAIQGIADQWGLGAEAAKPIVERMQAFASVIKAAVDVARAADVGGLASVTSPENLGAGLAAVKANVLAVFTMIGDIANDITIAEAKARADLAEALGRGMKGLGDFAGGIGSLMDLAESRLFGSTVGTAGLGHTQRTRSNRADFFAQQLRDTVIRAVKALQDALAGISITVDDPKTTAIAQLGDAFGKLAAGLKELSTTKLPDATKLAALVAALNGGAGGFAFAGAGGARIANVTADTATVGSITLGGVYMTANVNIDGKAVARGVVDAMVTNITILDDLGKALSERAARRP